MSYGLKVTGSHGDLVIDDTYRNIMKIAEGSCNNATFIDIAFPSPGAFTPQIFVRPWSDGSYVGACLFGDGYYSPNGPNTVRLLTNKLLSPAGTFGSTPANQGNIGFDYVIYGVNGITAIDGTNYGLKVWDAAGNVSFDSRYEQCRVQSVALINQSGLNTSNMTWPRTYTYAGWGGRPWININPFGYCYAAESDESGFFVTTSGTNAIVCRQGGFITNTTNTYGIYWIDNGAAGVVSPFPGLFVDVPLVRRYTD